MWRSIKTILVLTVMLADGGATALAQGFREPIAIQYDSDRLSQYSDMELIDLLSAESEDLDAKNHGGNYSDYSSAVEQELLRRRPIAEIVDIFGRSGDMTPRGHYLGGFFVPATSLPAAPAAPDFSQRPVVCSAAPSTAPLPGCWRNATIRKGGLPTLERSATEND